MISKKMMIQFKTILKMAEYNSSNICQDLNDNKNLD